MRSLVPGRDFGSSLNSGSAGVFVTASDDFCFFLCSSTWADLSVSLRDVNSNAGDNDDDDCNIDHTT